tara:strand:- start:233 stop:376 length:144 start_codon:yes stop_codon:yes gene_type:complete
MPIYLRKFYTRQLLSAKNKEREEMEKVQNKSSSQVARPGIIPKFQRS